MIGGVLGMPVATVGVRALVALSPPELPRIGSIGVDRGVFAFALPSRHWSDSRSG